MIFRALIVKKVLGTLADLQARRAYRFLSRGLAPVGTQDLSMVRTKGSIEGVDELLAVLNGFPGAGLRAVRRATSKTGTTAKAQIRRQAALDSMIPQKALKGRIFLRRPTRTDPSASLWFGVRPIAAHTIGKPRETAVGVTVGKHKFPGAFVANTGGTDRVFARRGASRLPIDTQRVEVNWGNIHLRGLHERFKTVLAQEVNYEISKLRRRG